MIKMPELKIMFETMGFGQVKTYINSGNVLFTSEEGPVLVRKRAEFEINKAFGIAVTVVIRTSDELVQIIQDCPYNPSNLVVGETIQVTLVTEAPPPEKITLMSADIGELDEFQVHGLTLYFLFRQSILDSRLAKNLTKLGKTATSRNMNTINKLAGLVEKMK